MPNIIDYLNWRGDLTLEQSEFNIIDNLILSRFSYFPLDNILGEKERITIKEVYDRFRQRDIRKEKILQKEDLDLFPLLAESLRFSEMKITNFVNKIDEKQEKQFSAVTIFIPDNTIYVSFRGTDNTIVGWKEDFNMSFKSKIAAQLDAVEYLEEIGKNNSLFLRVGGHSKGGNLAVYAAAFCEESLQKRILQVYNNDGPGFDDSILNTKNYKNSIAKVITLIPQTSIIGRLLGHEEKYTVIKSTQMGVMQHDLYTWQLQGKEFEYLEQVTNGSQIIDRTIKDWLQEVSPEEREQIISILFQILDTTQATTLAELKEQWFKNMKIVIKSYQAIDEESKKIMTKTLEKLITIGKNNLFNNIPKRKKENIRKLTWHTIPVFGKENNTKIALIEKEENGLIVTQEHSNIKN